MRTYIKVSDELRRKMWETFPVCKTTIWAALNYLTEGGRSNEIRAYALANGGKAVDEDFEPNCLTEHSQFEMKQSFMGGVCVLLDKKSGAVTLRVPGEKDEVYRDLPIKAWGNVLARAQEISNDLVSAKK